MQWRHCSAIAVTQLAVGIAWTAPSGAQTTAAVELGKRTGRTPYTFGSIFDVQELHDGRVIVSDPKEGAFRIVDFASGDMPVLGAPGDGPSDYRSAAHILRIGDDSLLLSDVLGRKLLHVSPEGEILGSSPTVPPEAMNRPPHTMLGVSGPLAVDGNGALYYQLELSDSTHDSAELADLVQVPADNQRQRVVNYLSTRRHDQVRPAPTTTVMPFLFRDAWAMRRDGLEARVMADSYQVVWSRDGREVGRTGPLRYQPIVVTATEQHVFRDSIIGLWNPKPASEGGTASSSPGGGGGGGRSGAATTGDSPPRAFTPPSSTVALRIPEIGPYPDRKPAIPNLRNTGVVFFDPAGRLWVTRERAHDDDIPHMDIIAEGRGLVAQVNLPKHSRVVGFGANTLYLAYHDSGGDWLERYSLPRF
jgi:hypothetical protein